MSRKTRELLRLMNSNKRKKKAKKKVKKKVVEKAAKKVAKKPEQPKRGRPPENKKIWRSVLRLPVETADRLKEAVAYHNEDRDPEDLLSINTTLATIIEVWLDAEGF